METFEIDPDLFYMENGVLKTTFKAKYSSIYLAYYIIENGKVLLKKGDVQCFNVKQLNELMEKLNNFINIGIKFYLGYSYTYYFISDKIDEIVFSYDPYAMERKIKTLVGDDVIRDEAYINVYSSL